jgi:hypothetical protein
LALAAWLCLAACSIDAGLFSEGEVIGGSGAGDAASTSSGDPSSSQQSSSSSSQSSGPTTTSSSSSSAGGSSGEGGAGAAGPGPGAGGSGGAPVCAHDLCKEGAALGYLCDPCVTVICDQDDYCCNTAWDDECTYLVFEICGQDCNPALPDCESQHQNTTGFVDVCGQRGEVCEIAFGSQRRCNDICNAAGTECLQVWDNQSGTICQHGGGAGCNTPANDAICLCSRGCGAGLPCGSTQTCVSGNCVN